MKKFLTIIYMILAAALIMTGCGNSQNVSKIVIGIDDEFAPMGFRDEQGNIIGFDVDLAREAAKRLNAEIEFKSIDWDNKESEITSGNIDMIWNGCDIMNEYKEYMIFSRPYMDNRQIPLVRKGETFKMYSEYDLADKIVGTQAGSNSEDYINENANLKNSLAAFKTYRNVKEGFEALKNGELDVLIVDEIAGRYEIIRHPKTFAMIELTVGPVTEFGIGFKKDNTELRDKVQGVFDEMIKDGTARKISVEWFGAALIKSK